MFQMIGVLFLILLCVFVCGICFDHFNFNLPCINKLQISADIE